MSQRHYLLNTSINSSDYDTLNKALADPSEKVIEVAECNYSLPLPWLACFRVDDLRTCTVPMSSGRLDIMVPCVDLQTAKANLRNALPLFEALTSEKIYAHAYWQNAIEELEKLPLPFLTMDIGEMLMSYEAEDLNAKLRTALGRNAEAIEVIKQHFIEYDNKQIPYDRSAFYANQEINDEIRIRNTIALDAAIQSNGNARTFRTEVKPEPATAAPATAPDYDEEFELAKLKKSSEIYSLAYQAQKAGDYKQAVILYHEAIELADSSQFKTGNMFYNGSAAACNLADKYEHGLGVPQDFQLAHEWYEKSAAKGNCVAQYSLGNLYKQGLGVPIDHTVALSWFLRSAAQDYADAVAEVKTYSVRTRSSALAKENGFVAGTLIHTKEGLRPIEEIKVGDWVKTNAEDAPRATSLDQVKEAIFRQVTATFANDIQDIVELRYPQTDKEHGIFRVSPHHPFMIKGVGWMQARNLRFGHKVMLGDFGTFMVGKTKISKEATRVYNFQVNEFQTYFVGKHGTWVHNGSVQEETSVKNFSDNAST